MSLSATTLPCRARPPKLKTVPRCSQRQNEVIAQGIVSNIFKNVAIYINGYVDPPLDELRAMVLQNGGVYHAYLDKKSLVCVTSILPSIIFAC